jgi:hypothetical protein
MSTITIRELANAELLAVGDLIAIYAGNVTPSHVARVDAVRHLSGTTVVVTDQGAFDLADTDQVSVVAWAPLPEHTYTGPGGKVYYYDGTPEDLEVVVREAELTEAEHNELFGWDQVEAGRDFDNDLADQERDRAEEAYNASLCPACGTSPCAWDGVTEDGFHVDYAEAE